MPHEIRSSIAAALVAACAAAGCAAHQQPSVEAAKAVTIVRYVDPRTVHVLGGVTVSVAVPARELKRKEEYAHEALKAEALREHPETTLLFDVTLRAGSGGNAYIVSGVAGRSRGD